MRCSVRTEHRHRTNRESTLKRTFFSLLADSLGEIALHWNLLDKTPLEKIARARQKLLSGHDDVIVDSTSEYLLLKTDEGLFLVSRKEAWKAKLGKENESLYAAKGKKSFRIIRMRLK